MVSYNFNIRKLINLAELAASKVKEIYNKDNIKIQKKDDKSPITEADIASQKIIIEGLSSLFPNIPIISEEKKKIPFEERKKWEYFWLIDPLDGTKEFVKRNGEFTINIALIYKGEPILGVISIPALDLLYFAQKTKGAFKKDKKGKIIPINVNQAKRDKVILLRSRSHSSPKEDEFISYLGEVEEIKAGSALKFCYLAEGKADVYLRMSGSMEWDTAAGQCIVESAGGRIFNLEGKPLKYNKLSLKNPSFFCFGNQKYAKTILK